MNVEKNNDLDQKKLEELLNLSREEKLNEQEILHQSIEQKNKQINELEEKNKNIYKQLLTLKADFENYRKRAEKEKKYKYLHGKIHVLEKILSLYDIISDVIKKNSIANDENCEEKQTKDNTKILDGLVLIKKEFEKILDKEGVVKINCLGEKYDPHKEEVLEYSHRDDEEEGVVIEVFSDGYNIEFEDEKILLRPAKVKVVKKTQSQQEEKNEQNNRN